MELIAEFPQISFRASTYFMWSPATRSITYDKRRIDQNDGRVALLHEIGHATLGHRMYKYDAELIKMEMDAWDFVRQHAPRYNLEVDEAHIARCISTYDDWLTKRSTCPDCDNFSLQSGRDRYHCFACGTEWLVNWRKDRRVTRTVVSRFQPRTHAMTEITPALAI